MKFLQFIWLMLVQLVQQILSLPKLLVQSGDDRKKRLAKNVNEAERLDRLRNPSKYRGK